MGTKVVGGPGKRFQKNGTDLVKWEMLQHKGLGYKGAHHGLIEIDYIKTICHCFIKTE